jgi:hypothetical protein
MYRMQYVQRGHTNQLSDTDAVVSHVRCSYILVLH